MFELPTKAQRLAHRMETVTQRAAALNGLARRLQSLARSMHSTTERHVHTLEAATAEFEAEAQRVGMKNAATAARMAWPEFHAASVEQDREIRETARLMQEVVGKILEAL
jgi:hypothetical protein